MILYVCFLYRCVWVISADPLVRRVEQRKKYERKRVGAGGGSFCSAARCSLIIGATHGSNQTRASGRAADCDDRDRVGGAPAAPRGAGATATAAAAAAAERRARGKRTVDAAAMGQVGRPLAHHASPLTLKANA